MTSIPLLVETIECTQFRCIYAKNKRVFLNFLVHFSNLSIFLTLIAYVFRTKNVLRQVSKSSRFKEPLAKRHGKRAELIQY